ncbi:MAG: tRNA 2-thiocytidine biosynthesis TtcA family protein [Marinifilaceae bacterium]|jgi:tRNA(Ile)-lysidine synthase TilS/MesJ|nr:tRNA 2-thiocytidine biosynthesis TtcA family protein [Marinifilaceae bacterium]
MDILKSLELKGKDLHYLKKINGKCGKAITEYKLIQPNDRILIGVSGGKDSLIMLENLAIMNQNARFDYKLFAIHINVSNVPYEIDKEYIKSLCDRYGIEFIFRTIDVDFDNKKHNKKVKSNCFVCSWNRRTELFKIAKEFDCNKIALGHHMDDIVETLLMNMAFQGSISTMPPLLCMDKSDLEIIRPMCLITEAEMIKYLEIRKFVLQKKNCPFEEESKRKEMKKILKQFEDLYPFARNNFYKSMNNIMPEYLPCKK